MDRHRKKKSGVRHTAHGTRSLHRMSGGLPAVESLHEAIRLSAASDSAGARPTNAVASVGETRVALANDNAPWVLATPLVKPETKTMTASHTSGSQTTASQTTASHRNAASTMDRKHSIRANPSSISDIKLGDQAKNDTSNTALLQAQVMAMYGAEGKQTWSCPHCNTVILESTVCQNCLEHWICPNTHRLQNVLLLTCTCCQGIKQQAQLNKPLSHIDVVPLFEPEPEPIEVPNSKPTVQNVHCCVKGYQSDMIRYLFKERNRRWNNHLPLLQNPCDTPLQHKPNYFQTNLGRYIEVQMNLVIHRLYERSTEIRHSMFRMDYCSQLVDVLGMFLIAPEICGMCIDYGLSDLYAYQFLWNVPSSFSFRWNVPLGVFSSRNVPSWFGEELESGKKRCLSSIPFLDSNGSEAITVTMNCDGIPVLMEVRLYEEKPLSRINRRVKWPDF